MSRPRRFLALAALTAAWLVAGGCSGDEDRLLDEAEALYDGGDLQGALRVYERALELDPDLHEAHYGVAVIHYSWERHAEALPSLDRAVALAPDNADYRVLRGDTLMMLGRYDEAISVYQAVIRADPSRTRLFYSVGIANYNKRDYEEAVRWLRRYVDADPKAIDRDRILEMIRTLDD
jgi:tetratricopeptide (TPR) repeat protein